ncbi:MAG TPA: phage holin family protein [Nitrospiraceae bacterium]|nr:phage holin family protein [Nitrospiraceae bacterium]
MPENHSAFTRPSMAALLTGLLDDVRTLIRQEYQLFKDEVSTELGELKAAIVAFLVGLFFLGAAALFSLLAVVHLLHEVAGLPLWASYGIFALLMLGGGLLALKIGSGTAKTFNLVPTRTIHSLKEDTQWIKQQMRWSRT